MINKGSFFRGISRNVIILGFVSLFTDISSQMVFPLIPLFMVTVLGTGAWAVGIVEGAAETTASLLKVFSGYWSDRLQRRKPFVVFGYSMSAVTKPLFAVASIWPIVLVVRVIERIGKGIRTAPRDAIVAESTDQVVMGKAYGFHRTMDGMGSILGAVLAYLFLSYLGYRNIFLLALLPGIIAVFFISLVRERRVQGELAEKKPNLKVSLTALPGNLKFFIIIATVFTLGHFGYPFLLLKAKNIGLSDQSAILLYVLFYSVYTIFSIPAGILSDRIGRRPVLMMGYGLFALTSLGLIFSSSISTLLLLFIVYGIFYAGIDGVQRAYVADLAPPNLEATALGTFHTAVGLAALPGGFIAGLIWDKVSPEGTFIYAIVLSLSSLLLFTLSRSK
jgi:MFS family permease